MKNKGIIFFIIIILIIVVGFLLFNELLKKNTIEQETQEKTILNKDATSFLIVPEQAGGNEIFIESVALLNVGYIVIHKEENGKPGEIIGVSELLPRGTKDNFLMAVNEEVVESDTLFAMIHIDDGNGVFDGNLDTPLIDDNNDTILVKFKIVNDGALDDEFKL